MEKRKRGRPKSPKRTVRLLSDGTACLSHDLAKIGDIFIVRYVNSKISFSRCGEVSVGIQTLIKDGWPIVRAYASNPKAASPLISLMGTLTAMGIPREVQSSLAGTYQAQIQKDGLIVFDLEKLINKV